MKARYFIPLLLLASNSYADTVYEAENQSLTNYAVENVGSASGGKLVRAGETVASLQFTAQESGLFNIIVGYAAENDGTDKFELYQNGNLISAWDSANTSLWLELKTHEVKGIRVTEGDIFTVSGTRTPNSKARLDYITFESQEKVEPWNGKVIAEWDMDYKDVIGNPIDVKSYWIYKSVNNSTYSKFIEVEDNDTGHISKELINVGNVDDKLCIKVSAVSTDGLEGATTEPVCATLFENPDTEINIPVPPSGIQIKVVPDSTGKLTVEFVRD